MCSRALLIGFLLGSILAVQAQETIRFATYNIENLDAGALSEARKTKLKFVIEELGAHVIALVEIKDRAALEAIFDKTNWQLIIDNDSRERQNLALAVHKDIPVKMPDLNADDEDFLYPETNLDQFFPGRRDVLKVKLTLSGKEVLVLVVHAKARSEGRVKTAPRRIGAAQRILAAIDDHLDETPTILMGDMNDTPDDASMNILESGDPKAQAEMEEREQGAMINLTQPLWAEDLVTWGYPVVQDRPEIHLPGIRARQFADRNTDKAPSENYSGLLDNILVNAAMNASYVTGSTRIYSGSAAVGASDHLPVSADFQFGKGSDPVKPPPARMRIAELLPNPDGNDPGNEKIAIFNGGTADEDLEGWFVKDRSGQIFDLEGLLGRGKSLSITLPAKGLALNNNGDTLTLFNPDRVQIDEVAYIGADAVSGRRITYGEPGTQVPDPPDHPSPTPVPGPSDQVRAYYARITQQTGPALKQALHDLIRSHKQLSYNQVWDVLAVADEHPTQPDSVMAFYKRVPIKKTAKASGGTCNDCWNREHIWAKSHGFPNSGQLGFTDVHHLRASDVTVNSSRGNLDFDEGGQPEGECTGCRKDDDSWEPPAEVRGDIARMMFYMDARYDGTDPGMPDLTLIKGDSPDKSPQFGNLCALLKWHREDKVSEEERKRNQIIFNFQGNRNPFIDFPEWVEKIWTCN